MVTCFHYLQMVPNIQMRNKEKLIINRWHLHVLLLYTISLPANIICQHTGLFRLNSPSFLSKGSVVLVDVQMEEHFQVSAWDGNPYVVSKVCAGPPCLRFHSAHIGSVWSHSSSLMVHLPVNQANSMFCFLSPCLKVLVFLFPLRYHFKTAIQTVVSHSENF